ncbi:hypothetical protein [Haloactinopolyspora alba]|nr:hypothetical protein [Haloactinopolyspora alba]
MAVTHGDLVLRPAPSKQREILILATVLGAVFVALAAVYGATAALVTAAAVAAGLALLAAASSRSRIVVTADEIAVVGPLRRRNVSRTRAASVVRTVLIPGRGPIVDTVFVLDGDGQGVLRISGHRYATDDVDRLVEHLGLPVSSPDRPLGMREFAEAYPGTVSRDERQPFRMMLVGAGIGVATIVLLAVLVGVGAL